MRNKEGRAPASATASVVSDTQSTACYGQSPQEKKRTSTVAAVEKLLPGFSFKGALGEQLAEGINDAIRTGARKVNPDNEDSYIECNAEWHFARFRGEGKTYALSLYSISWHLAKKSGNFYLSIPKLARFLGVKDNDELYAAAHLLTVSGFLEVVEAEIGKAVKYRPVGHTEWAERHPGRCTKKLELKFSQKDEALALLGRNLHSIFGGEKFFPNVVRGYRAANKELTDEQICEQAKTFFAGDCGRGSGKGRRQRFTMYLRGVGIEKFMKEKKSENP